MKIEYKGNDVNYTFASYKDFFNYSTSKPTLIKDWDKKCSIDSSFYEFKDYNTYLNSVKNVSKKEHFNRKKLVPGVAGGSVNIASYLSGSPLNMYNIKSVNKGNKSSVKKSYKLCLSYNYNITSSQICEFFNKIKIEIEKDIKLGNRFEITVYLSSYVRTKTSNVNTCINIKGLNDLYSEDVLSVVFSPDFQRRAVFRLYRQDTNNFDLDNQSANVIDFCSDINNPFRGITVI
jgi:hypothetical protein